MIAAAQGTELPHPSEVGFAAATIDARVTLEDRRETLADSLDRGSLRDVGLVHLESDRYGFLDGAPGAGERIR